MTTTSDRITELRTNGRRAAVATLVATTGGAIRRLGETMWVDDQGAIVGSVTIGGCVDGRAVEMAEEVLRTGRSRRASLPLGDEDAWAFGMTCAGNVELYVEPVDARGANDPIAAATDALTTAVRAGKAAVEARSMGDRPMRLVVLDDGTRHGTLGDATLDDELARRASALIDERTTGIVSLPASGATSEVFVQVYAPPPSVVIVGATDAAAMLVQLARPLGFHTTVFDGRERWATHERFPNVDVLRVGIPSELVARLELGPANALVLLSHDFKYDFPVLEVALRTRVGYIGVLGSRRRARAIADFLSSIGASADDVARVRVPIGLDIGARTPAEIALSVLAELVAVRNRRAAEGR